MGNTHSEPEKKGNGSAGKGKGITYNYSGANKTYEDGRGRTAHRTVVRLVKLLDVIMVAIPFTIAWTVLFSHQMYAYEFFRRGNWFVIGLHVVMYYLLSHLYGGYQIHIGTVADIIYAQTLGAVITDGMMYIILWLLIRYLPNIPVMLLVLAGQMLMISVWTKFAHQWYYKNNPPIPTAVIYDEFEGLEGLVSHYGMDKQFKIVKKLNIHDLQGDNWYSLPSEERTRREQEYIDKVLEGCEACFLCSLHSHDRNQFIKYCIHKDIISWCIPRIGDVLMLSAEKQHLFHLPMLRVEKYNPTPEYLIAKRIFDIVVSGLAFIVFSPIMVILAIIIRMDGGTAFYRQKRLTKDGKVFEILKFRSMRMDAEKDGVARLSSGEADPRITKVGRFIRACRLDELPQLINILRGDMSIVGPRPERPEIAEQYKKELPEFDLRLQCKCGLTGFAQVYGQYNSTPYDKLLMDLMYIAQPSMAEDLKICFATVKILFMSDSTEGVAEGQVTAMKKGASKEKAEPAAETIPEPREAASQPAETAKPAAETTPEPTEVADAQPSEPPAEDKENSNE